MGRIRWPQMTLLGRIALFLTAFAAAMVLQIGISYYQSRYVMEPLERRSASIQVISQFLNDVEACMTALENHRWDYGDTASLIAVVQENDRLAAGHLEHIDADLRTVGEEQYMLANAARTTYRTLHQTLDEIVSELQAGSAARASELYYGSAERCGMYLRQYTQQLLEQACFDNEDAYTRLTQLNEGLKRAQTTIVLVCIGTGLMLVVSLMRLLRAVSALVQASQAIGQGQFDTPDLDESQDDETGHMAKTFNEMKRSTRRQVELLNEKRSMEGRLHAKEMEALELQNLLEREKLQQLRGQINPHFLFNTLNVIMYTCQQEGAEKTRALIGSLCHLFRYALGSNESQVPLAREVRIVDEFYALNRARFGERLLMCWHIGPEVDLADSLVPSFILQPLVENAFKHGLAPKEEGGRVDIDIGEEDGLLKIAVRDDGVGMSPETLESLRDNLKNPPTAGEHIGLYNVAARLRLWGAEYGLDIQSRQGEGTTAVLCLPLVLPWDEEGKRMIKVLIADDEGYEREILTGIMEERLGREAEVRVVENGRLAVDAAALWAADVALLDIEMPGINGIDAARQILAQRPECKIIFITAYSLFTYAHEAVRLGACDYILKPVDPDDVERAVRRAAAQAEAQRQLEATAASGELLESADNYDKAAVLMGKVKKYLQHNYMRYDISLDSVSAILNLNASYFSSLFKRTFQVNFLDYLTELRMDAARELLRDPLRSTAEVANMVGYESANYFTRAFKKKVGMTPTEYRRGAAQSRGGGAP